MKASLLAAILFASASIVFAYFFTTEPMGVWSLFSAIAAIWSAFHAFRFSLGGAR